VDKQLVKNTFAHNTGRVARVDGEAVRFLSICFMPAIGCA